MTLLPMPPDTPTLVTVDPSLAPYAAQIQQRGDDYLALRAALGPRGGLLGAISQGHHYFGFNRGEDNGVPGIWYREWAPAAHRVHLIGDFNGWSDRDPLWRDLYGVWHLFLPDGDAGHRIPHGSLIKVRVQSDKGTMERIPAYAKRVVQDAATLDYTAQLWMPDTPYRFQHPTPRQEHGLRIYEAHVGIASEEHKIASYTEFAEQILPRIARLGYNAVQLMGVMEHPYYASFGYHVSSFFAASSRFGTPEELKYLIDTAHGLGLHVFLDLVHSHAVKNVNEGLNLFDGTDFQYFHAGARGQHPAWDSLLFNYATYEVQRFLLSNVRYWLEEFRFDGFRFDGVTSMLFSDHGLNREFGSYDDYFDDNVDKDAVLYLQMANDLAHAVRHDAVTIAEEVSGMPGMARPTIEGGIGFDYRLSMGIPDYWVRQLEEPDEMWGMEAMFSTLLNRRASEKHIGYVESHDQAIVGGKTLLSHLIGAEIYDKMHRVSESLVVDRGIALHKMIRLVTFSLAGEGYLNFMGNEFGHPEWLDFPRRENNESFQYARRQWSLADNEDLRYSDLQVFDTIMLILDTAYNLLNDPFIELLSVDEDGKRLIYRRGPLVFVLNFHPVNSYSHLRIPVPDAEDYTVLLNTDDRTFGGFGRCGTETITYPMQLVPLHGRGQSIEIYLPSRSAQVLVPRSAR